MTIMLLHNAHIYTGDVHHPWAAALAIADGKIVGLDQQAMRWADAPGIVKQDLAGATVLPGLIDAHIHMMWYAMSLKALNLRGVSREQLLQRLAEHAAELPAGQWITGRGWDQNIWSDPSFPTAKELDRVTPRHPVSLIAKSGHAVVANTPAMHLAGITMDTPDPMHGKIGRHTDGTPNGMFFEQATRLIKNVIPDPTLIEVAEAIDVAQDHLLAQGITGIHDVDGTPAFGAFQELHRLGHLRLRVVKYVRLEVLDAILEAGLRTGFGDDWLRFGGLKLFADGALGARTGAMFEPYVGEPDNVGVLTLEPDQLCDIVRRASAGGLAMAIHAIGDRANALVLDSLETAGAETPPLRHRIEHVQHIRPEDQVRLGKLGLVASMQPIHAVHDYAMSDRYLGARSAHAYAWRSILRAGAVLAFGSDAPIERFDPFSALYAAVTRRDEEGAPGPSGWYPEQRLTLEQALRAYTRGAAYAASMEKRLGLLTPGYYADLIELDRDIFTLPPEALLETHVQRVMVEGKWQLRHL